MLGATSLHNFCSICRRQNFSILGFAERPGKLLVRIHFYFLDFPPGVISSLRIEQASKTTSCIFKTKRSIKQLAIASAEEKKDNQVLSEPESIFSTDLQIIFTFDERNVPSRIPWARVGSIRDSLPSQRGALVMTILISLEPEHSSRSFGHLDTEIEHLIEAIGKETEEGNSRDIFDRFRWCGHWWRTGHHMGSLME